jgi:PAS domain S-box-containing protein
MATKTYLELIDKKEQEVVGQRFFDVLPELRESVEHLLLKVLKTGEPYYGNEFKIQIRRYGKTENAYFDFVYYPLKDEAGSVTGVMVVASEVTPLVQAKFRIQESEKKFRQLLMRSPVPMCILQGKDLVIDIANEVMIKSIWQKDEASVIGRKLFDVFPELKDQKYAALVQEVYASGHPHSEKEAAGFVNGPNGVIKLYMDYEYTPLFDDNGKVWGVLVTIADVTEKVQARKKVEASEETLNIVIEATDLGTWEVNFKTGEIGYSERYVEIVLGYKETKKLSHAELVKRIHPDDLPVRERAYKRALETGVLHYFTRLVMDDGSIRWVEGKGKLFHGSEGKPERMLGTIRDVTEERNQTDLLETKVLERTRELAQKNADLERMNTDLQSFAYISSHDLQEPLRKIQTFTSRIRDKEKLSEQGLDYFHRIQRSAHQMQVLIQDLLTYSRTSRQDHKFEEIGLDKLVEEVRSDFHEALAEKNGHIEIGNSLPVKIITLQFKQVMSNLISNALKFSRPDVAPQILIDATKVRDQHGVKSMLLPERQYVKIRVADNGIGFEPDYNEKIFEVFQRLHSKHEYSGTGIGLAIVKRIVENHEGFIEAHGEVGKGARFDIYLPQQ